MKNFMLALGKLHQRLLLGEGHAVNTNVKWKVCQEHVDEQDAGVVDLPRQHPVQQLRWAYFRRRWTLQEGRNPVGCLLWKGLHDVKIPHEGGSDTLDGELGLGLSNPDSNEAYPELGKLDRDGVVEHGVSVIEQG